MDNGGKLEGPAKFTAYFGFPRAGPVAGGRSRRERPAIGMRPPAWGGTAGGVWNKRKRDSREVAPVGRLSVRLDQEC